MKVASCAFAVVLGEALRASSSFVLPSLPGPGAHRRARQGRSFSCPARARAAPDRPYEFRSEPGGPLPEGVDARLVESLVARRVEARRTRDYDAADSIQRELKDRFNVYMDDGERVWGVGLRRREPSAAGGVGGGDDDLRRHRRRSGIGGGGPPVARQTRRYRRSERSRPLPPDEEAAVVRKVEERAAARGRGDYDAADRLRADLAETHDVAVDDDRRLWSAGGKFPGRPDRFLPYSRSPLSEPLGDDRLEALIQRAVEERARSRKDRDFDRADALRTGLRGKYGVAIDDELRQWSAGGRFERPPARDADNVDAIDLGRPYVQRGGDGGLEGDVLERIRRTVAERQRAKSDRDFDLADALRDELIETYNLVFDDKRREWRIDTGEYARVGGAGEGEGGGGGPDPLSADDVANIQSRLAERTAAKRRGDYGAADAIRDELRDGYAVIVDDRAMEWRALSAGGGEEDPYVAEAERSQRSAFARGRSREGGGAATAAVSAASGGGSASDEELDSGFDTALEAPEGDEPAEVSAASSSAAADLSSLTVKELRERLRVAGMPVSGVKAVLVERLLQQM